MKTIACAIPAAIIAVMLVGTVPARLAARHDAQLPSPSFQSAVSLVALNVTVQDGKAQYVTGLRPEDFRVLEDGVVQDVRFFESSSLPIDLIVLLDTSSSMLDKLGIAQRAARGFLDTLRPGDRGAVIAFNHAVHTVVPLTADRCALDQAINATVAGGNTALHTAIYVALKKFGLAIQGDTAVRRQAIAVVSDGEDTSSLVTFDDVLGLARQTGINVYTVRLQSGDPLRDINPRSQRVAEVADFEMKTLARETGGLSFFPPPKQLQTVYASIAKELANQYSIGYEPKRTIDGAFRRVQVQLVNRPDLRARTRAGYVAGADRISTLAPDGSREAAPPR